MLASILRTQQIQRTDFDLEIEAHLNGVMNSLSVTDRKKEQIKKGYEDDTDMCALKDIIMSGWPKEQTNCSDGVQPYWNYRDCSERVDSERNKNSDPKEDETEHSRKIAQGHLGQEKCKRRARATVFWPGINKDIEKMVNQCSDCIDHRDRHCPAPLVSHSVPTQAWSKVGSDVFQLDNKNYLVIVDYHSNYPDVYQIPSQSSKSVITTMKESFGRFGIPDLLLSGNGPCYEQ